MTVARPGSLARDEYLYQQSRPAELLYRIDDGYLITHVMTPSRDVGLSIYGPGDIVGTPNPHTRDALHHLPEYLESAQAITPVTYTTIINDGHHLRDFVLPPRHGRTNEPLDAVVLLLDRLERAQACSARQGGTSHEAVRLLFEELLDRYGGTRQGSFIMLDIPLTHQHIAMLVNCTRETISKTLADLRKEGVLSNSRSPYGVNPDKLL